MKPLVPIVNRWQVEKAYNVPISKPTPNKPPKQATPICSAIEERRLPDPVYIVGQGRTATMPDPRGTWSLWAFIIGATCGIGGVCAIVYVVLYR